MFISYLNLSAFLILLDSNGDWSCCRGRSWCICLLAEFQVEIKVESIFI